LGNLACPNILNALYQQNDSQPQSYKEFHGFGQAKYAYGGLVFRFSQFSLLPPGASKNNT